MVVAILLLVAVLGGRLYRQGSGYHLHCCRCDAGYSRPASGTLEQQAMSLHPATDCTRNYCWLGACKSTVLKCRGGHIVCNSQWDTWRWVALLRVDLRPKPKCCAICCGEYSLLPCAWDNIASLPASPA